jgi:hypothetical protein
VFDERTTMSSRQITAALALVMAMGTAYAQQAATPETAGSAPAKPPCVQQKRHDHGAERYAPTPRRKCKDAAAETQKSEGKPAQGHDHAKTHKLM